MDESKLSATLVEQVTRHPLTKQAVMEKFLQGDLALGAKEYARKASCHGTDGAWWRIWWLIQKERGLSAQAAFKELKRENIRWFSLWSLETSDFQGIGLDAYRFYLDLTKVKSETYGPFSHELCRFLAILIENGNLLECRETVDGLYPESIDRPSIHLMAAEAEMLLGDLDAAEKRTTEVRSVYHDDPNAWAMTALLASRRGDSSIARNALLECAKLNLHDSRLIEKVRNEFNLKAEGWDALVSPFDFRELDHDEEMKRWLRNPGARIRPSDDTSPHWCGGSFFQMPPCLMCGHLIQQWFVIDIRELPPLHERLPTWKWFPLLGCVDCTAWGGRHDYEVETQNPIVHLVNVAMSLKDNWRHSRPFAPLPHRWASLQWEAPSLDGTEEEFWEKWSWNDPQIGGVPAWVQEPLRLFCRTCRSEMVFVAAMATNSIFGPEIFINNGSGLQYHFACDACHTISVVARHT